MSLGLSAGAWLAAGAVGGGLIAANGAKSAAKTQAAAADRASEISAQQAEQARADQMRMYDTTRADQLALLDQQRQDFAPYRDQGYKSLAELARGNEPGGEFTRNYQREQFQADPGYLFRMAEGEKAINRGAAARGGFNSGATLKALARYNSDLASQEYGAWDQRQNTREAQFNANRDFRRNNIATLAGIGQTATTATSNAGAGAYGQIAGAGQNAYNQITSAGNIAAMARGNAAQGAGEARASGYVGTANAIGGGIRQLYNNWQQNQYMNPVNSYGNSPAVSNSLADWSNSQNGYLDPGYDGP